MRCNENVAGQHCPIESEESLIHGRHYCPFHAVMRFGIAIDEHTVSAMHAAMAQTCGEETDVQLTLPPLLIPKGFRFPEFIRRPFHFEVREEFDDPDAFSEVRSCKSLFIQFPNIDLRFKSLVASGPVHIRGLRSAVVYMEDCEGNSQVTLQCDNTEARLVASGSVFAMNLSLVGHSANYEAVSTAVHGNLVMAQRCNRLHISGTSDRRSSIGALVHANGHLSGPSQISSTDFLGTVDLTQTVVGDLLSVYDTRFAGALTLAGTLFNKGLKFNNVDVTGAFNARAVGTHTDIGALEFGVTRFHGPVDFNGRKFKDFAHFHQCEFDLAPKFFDCTFHQGIRFPPASSFKDTSAAAVEAYRTLKQYMEALRARREEGTFYALEQRSLLAKPCTLSRNEQFASRAYGALSDYGQNFFRPVLLFIGLIGAFTGFFAGLLSEPCGPCEFRPHTLLDGFKMSVEYSVNPFSVWRKPGAELGTAATQIQLLATLQSLLAVIFLALFLLALRWRFKRD